MVRYHSEPSVMLVLLDTVNGRFNARKTTSLSRLLTISSETLLRMLGSVANPRRKFFDDRSYL